MDYWYSTESYQDWYRSRRTISTLTTQKLKQTISLSTPTLPIPTGNATYSILCDGLPRFDKYSEASKALQPISITPIITTITTTYMIQDFKTPPNATMAYPHVRQTCSARSPQECTDIWNLYSSSVGSRWNEWTKTNILTISLASPPTAIAVNGKTTPLTPAKGSYPIITLHGEAYSPVGQAYSISRARNFYGETTLRPGQQAVLTWNYDDLSQIPFAPIDNLCGQPYSVIEEECAAAQCTMAAGFFELMYFAPPSTSRDICANTSPGFDSSKCLFQLWAVPFSSREPPRTALCYKPCSLYPRCLPQNQLPC